MKKAPKSPKFIDSSKEEEEGASRYNKCKKRSPLLGVKNLTIKKRVERVIFINGPYKGQELLYVATYDTSYVKRVLKTSDKKTKDLIKQALAKT